MGTAKLTKRQIARLDRITASLEALQAEMGSVDASVREPVEQAKTLLARACSAAFQLAEAP